MCVVCIPRESELAKVREEERTRCETKLRNLRIEQEESHRQKMESLRRLEMAAVDDARRRQLEGEAALFARRQELEVQLVAVGAREEQLRRETESRMQALSLAEQRLTVAAEQVALRERELLQYRDRVEGVVRAELAGWESRLKEEQSRQDSARVEFDQAREAVRLERGRREEVEGQLHKASKQLVELQTQREESLRAIEKVSIHIQYCCSSRMSCCVDVRLLVTETATDSFEGPAIQDGEETIGKQDREQANAGRAAGDHPWIAQAAGSTWRRTLPH